MPRPAEPLAPDYWALACAHLVKKDRVMKKIIAEQPGMLTVRRDAFSTLARSVVGQQITVAAAQTVWDKLVDLAVRSQAGRPSARVAQQPSVAGEAPTPWLTPAGLLKLKVDDLRALGLSARKTEYLVDLAMHFERGALHVDQWQAHMTDEAITAELVAVRGISRWTADMFLIFHLLRPNVLPLDDPGLIKGISQLYFSGEPVSRSDARDMALAWAPYSSVATWYIWRSLDTPATGG
jgi:DNA-3-methyladenine glycosylase II